MLDSLIDMKIFKNPQCYWGHSGVVKAQNLHTELWKTKRAFSNVAI